MDAERAGDALGVLRSGRERVVRESQREKVVEIASRAVATVLWLGVKDIRRPAVRRTAGVVLYAGLFGWAAWRLSRSKVMGVFNEQQELRAAQAKASAPQGEELKTLPWREQLRLAATLITPEQKRGMAIALALSASRRLVVMGFRRSGIRYPHLAAGVVTAAAQATVSFLELRRKRASDDE